jgi:hypothetical protein
VNQANPNQVSPKAVIFYYGDSTNQTEGSLAAFKESPRIQYLFLRQTKMLNKILYKAAHSLDTKSGQEGTSSEQHAHKIPTLISPKLHRNTKNDQLPSPDKAAQVLDSPSQQESTLLNQHTHKIKISALISSKIHTKDLPPCLGPMPRVTTRPIEPPSYQDSLQPRPSIKLESWDIMALNVPQTTWLQAQCRLWLIAVLITRWKYSHLKAVATANKFEGSGGEMYAKENEYWIELLGNEHGKEVVAMMKTFGGALNFKEESVMKRHNAH